MERHPPGGAILIGFKCAATKDGRYPAAVQGIYQTPAGEVLGRGFGKLERGQQLETVKAKPGCAVGAVFTRGGIAGLSIVTLRNGSPMIKKRSIFRTFPRRP